jgi:hypothetical protein
MLLAFAFSVAIAAPGAHAADAVKPGQWEFQTRLQGAGAGMAVSHRQCVQPDKAVPSDPRGGCKVDRMQRSGNVINWTTSCQAAQGTVVSTGVARYRGDTMDASMNTRAPNGSGGFIDTTQHITGRYLGPCSG